MVARGRARVLSAAPGKSWSLPACARTLQGRVDLALGLIFAPAVPCLSPCVEAVSGSGSSRMGDAEPQDPQAQPWLLLSP